jgi:FKBP-type peptidyl-prolyl cis-trans isomerase FkpA
MKKLLLTLSVAALLAGCLKNEDNRGTCTFDECNVKAPAAEIQNVKNYLTQNSINAVEHCSGLFYAIDSMGTGISPDVCSGVSVRYKGMLTNGSIFDSTSRSTSPFALRDLVRGWIIGLPKIKQGGGIRLYIPPTLGYGTQDVTNRATGAVIIPGNSVLVFEVKLDAVFQ